MKNEGSQTYFLFLIFHFVFLISIFLVLSYDAEPVK